MRNVERLCLAHFWVAFAAFAAAAVLGAWQMWVRSPLGAHVGTPGTYFAGLRCRQNDLLIHQRPWDAKSRAIRHGRPVPRQALLAPRVRP